MVFIGDAILFAANKRRRRHRQTLRRPTWSAPRKSRRDVDQKCTPDATAIRGSSRGFKRSPGIFMASHIQRLYTVGIAPSQPTAIVVEVARVPYDLVLFYREQ